MKTVAIAIMIGSACMAAVAAERPVSNAAYLQLVFTQTASDCKAAQVTWSRTHSSAHKSMITGCFANATPPSNRRRLPPYFFQVISTATPLSQPSGVSMTLTYRALGPVQLADGNAGANPKPPGDGPIRFYQMMVFSGPTAGQDSVYNDWYDHQHVPDVMRNAGFISGQRFLLTTEDSGKELNLPPYLVLFTLKSGDLKATGDEIGARIHDGRTRMSPAFDGQGGTAMFATPL